MQPIQNVRGSGALTPSPLAQRPKEALSVGTLSSNKKYGKLERRGPSQIETECAQCGCAIYIWPSEANRADRHFCSLVCRGASQFKGGIIWNTNGRAKVYRPGHPRADKVGYVYRNILVAEEKLGRPILRTEQVHHRDEDKSNDHPDNLIVLPAGDHYRRFHGANGRWSRDYDACVDCGETDKPYAGHGRCERCRSKARVAARKAESP
jgi:hypothetical protein